MADHVFAKIPVYEEQELHVRVRTRVGVPRVVEQTLYNTQGGGYRLSLPVPDDPVLVGAMIEALQRWQTERAERLAEWGEEEEEV